MYPLHSSPTVEQEVGYSSKDAVEYSAKEDIGYSSKSAKDVIEDIPEALKNPLDGRYYPPVIPPTIINPPCITDVNPRLILDD